MSDMVLLADDRGPFFPKIFDSQQDSLDQFLVRTLKLVRDKKTGQFNYKAAVARLKHNAERLDQLMKKSKYDSDWDKFRKEVCDSWNIETGSPARDGDTLAEAMRIELAAARLVSRSYGLITKQFCVTNTMQEVLATADTGMCRVFLLKNTEPDALTLKEALLECMLNGICEPQDDTAQTFGKKVQYTIRWECVKILGEVLTQSGLKSDEKKQVVRI